jgi:hypothetical protein
MKRATIILSLIVLLLFVGSALAMSSTNYRLDWYTPMTGAGGGPASSAHYAANFTVGQTVVGASSSEHFRAGLGYWYGLLSEFIRNFLPLVLKS